MIDAEVKRLCRLSPHLFDVRSCREIAGYIETIVIDYVANGYWL
jgi:hypothetical protein